MAEYPKRDKFFANRFVRLLTKTAAAQDIGSEACWLLTIVAQQEDSKWYTGEVLYWNEQLSALCGFGSTKRLRNIRNKAIEAGWLYYEHGGKCKAGRYWVIIPGRFENLPDGPCDENPEEYRGESHRQREQEDDLSVRNEAQKGTERDLPGTERTDNGPTTARQRPDNGHTFIPIPNPIPNPKKESARVSRKFVKPTVEEVAAYCTERKNSLEPEQFIDHYESNGWKVGGKAAMKDWKAAVRTWERNGVSARGSPKSGGTAIDAWDIAVKLSNYRSKFSVDDPGKWRDLQDECREKHPEIYEFICKFGLKSFGEGNREIVRGQFVKLWNDSS